MTTLKLNVLLAKTDHLAGVYKKNQEDYIKFFKNSPGSFKGEKKTYQPKEGTIDLPKERSTTLVVTTVPEKLEYLHKNSADYIDALFSLEKTNSSGKAQAELIVDGKSFGVYTSMELLRLKSLLESGTLKEMYETLPVRNDDENWAATTSDSYTNRKVFESTKRDGVYKSTLKESYILPDPNIDKIEGAKYVAQIAQKDTIIELGDYTYQKFSGETSHIERAAILQRRSKLLVAVIEALKTSNEVAAEKSEMTADKLFNYLHSGN